MGFARRDGITCCYECQDRHTACHDACEKYQKQRAEYRERVANIKKEKNKDSAFDSWKISMVRQTKARGRIRSNNSSVINHKLHKKED